MKQQIIELVEQQGTVSTDDVLSHLGLDALQNWAKIRALLDEMVCSGSLKIVSNHEITLFGLGDKCKQEN